MACKIRTSLSKVGDAADFIPAFEEAKRLGLKLALHLAEV